VGKERGREGGRKEVEGVSKVKRETAREILGFGVIDGWLSILN
jgi:hypothetical protein